MSKLKKLAFSGILWNIIQLIINQGASFIVKLILARVLFPEQFGLVGMAVVFIGFVQVFNDLGIGASLIQMKDEKLRESHYHTAFWTSVFWSLFMYGMVVFVVSPIAANFYNEQMLKDLIPVLGLGILASPFNIIHKAQLTKQMNFKRMAVINNISNVSSGLLSIILAFSGAGVWSLAFNSVATFVIAIPLFFNATKWYPKFIFEKEAFKEIFGFGIFTTGTVLTNYVISNVDYLLIGKLVSAQALGAYTFAFILTDIFRSKLMGVMNTVFYPLYSKMQDNPASLKKYYLKVVEYNSIVIYPIMIFFILMADPVVLILFGDKWMNSLDPLQILSLAVMVHMMVNSNTALIRGLGKPDLEMKLQVIKAIIYLPMVYYAITNYGILGASIAVLINKVIAVIIAQITFKKYLSVNISTNDFLLAIRLPMLAAIFTAIVVGFCNEFLNFHYIISSLLIFIIYGSIVWFYMGTTFLAEIKEVKSL
ncbi:lipopolysaccharide biosynthesis protein [Cyclobacterium marinum]|uniref:Polysaccharide biosynthesis protein n=1 Tax=Cyclobacterium marinum (strain ATCC 25205 / DSM 745 / LMG 13164 / NCIMB 1802) TaxID=880070 RepID=G0J662_CYCMS|nr:lipopolysaccharide biosynthesis protein [Cyclobacterium marinum]AEL26814.1 polysaccharide biosynthesis protein [Cyclobacterium marinum DSM 745]